jgi:hypothetical protein
MQAMTKGLVTVRASINVIFLLLVVFAKSPSLVAGGGSPTRPLQLRLMVPEPEICVGAAILKMDAIFSNNSDSPIAIYKAAIYDFSFTKTVQHDNHSKVESHEKRKDVGTGDPALREAPIVLQPHGTIVVPLEYDVSDPFFCEVATYSVRVRYRKAATSATAGDAAVGDFGSNEVFLLVSECRRVWAVVGSAKSIRLS